MKHSTVINNAPWVIAFGTILSACSFFVHGPLSVVLVLTATIVISAAMGALLTHYPS